MTGHEKTPKEIVAELDKYVVGQSKAKKAVAIALRNRYRRMQLSEDMQEEITPKNMMMIGPTGVGKTEIARRLAKIVDAPFIKVEATKFTEVGYVGRDVESMVRDLVEVSYKMEEDEMFKNVRAEAVAKADKRLVKLLVPAQKKQEKMSQQQAFSKMMSDLQSGNYANLFNQQEEPEDVTDEIANKRMSVAEKLRQGYLENEEVTIQMDEPSTPSGAADGMLGQMGVDLSDALAQITPKKKITRTVTVKEAREILVREESAKLVNSWDIADAAIKRAENTGIIFIDEIDKITSKSKQNSGEVSREGVQRDILPIVEGSAIKTKYGMIKTDHILFIASGAFAESKPSDLIAELQGRFPIRVELDDLQKEDFVRILTEPRNALVKQYQTMLKMDGVDLSFEPEALTRVAEIALDRKTGARGLRNVMESVMLDIMYQLPSILEKLLEDLLFEGPDMHMGEITITEAYVEDKVGSIVDDKDLSQYIL